MSFRAGLAPDRQGAETTYGTPHLRVQLGERPPGRTGVGSGVGSAPGNGSVLPRPDNNLRIAGKTDVSRETVTSGSVYARSAPATTSASRCPTRRMTGLGSTIILSPGPAFVSTCGTTVRRCFGRLSTEDATLAARERQGTTWPKKHTGPGRDSRPAQRRHMRHGCVQASDRVVARASPP